MLLPINTPDTWKEETGGERYLPLEGEARYDSRDYRAIAVVWREDGLIAVRDQALSMELLLAAPRERRRSDEQLLTLRCHGIIAPAPRQTATAADLAVRPGAGGVAEMGDDRDGPVVYRTQ